MEDLIKTEESKLLGGYIHQKTIRNENNTEYPVQGVSNSMSFMATKAKTKGLNFSNYKIVKNGSLAYNPSRLNIGSIALRNAKDCIVSPMYVVFDIIDKSKLLPEYLFLWFKRDSFKNYVWFYSFGSVRDTFDFNLMKEVKLPIPDIKIQEAIVTIYHTLETRKRINEQLKDSIKPFCPVLMRGVVEEIEKSEVVI
jgi:type I restriction enzyme S subunit